MKINDNIYITNEDNMELMKRYPDSYFDLAIVDPWQLMFAAMCGLLVWCVLSELAGTEISF